MKKYHFELQRTTIPQFKQLSHIIHAWSLADAVQKFSRKHSLISPAYWDEPSFETFIDMVFTSEQGSAWYSISW